MACGGQARQVCGSRLLLEFREDYTPATDSIPPGNPQKRKED